MGTAIINTNASFHPYRNAIVNADTRVTRAPRTCPARNPAAYKHTNPTQKSEMDTTKAHYLFIDRIGNISYDKENTIYSAMP